MARLYIDQSGMLVNMYDCTPCPKCKQPFRCVFNSKPGYVQCDDCGHQARIKRGLNVTPRWPASSG